MNPGAATAARLLAHRLLERAERGAPPDVETARRLVDERLAASPDARRTAVESACRIADAVLAERGPGGRLSGRMRCNLRVGVRNRAGRARVVVVPTLILHGDGAASVVAAAPPGDREARGRALRYRRAARALLRAGAGAPTVRAFVADEAGVEELSAVGAD